MRAGWQAPKSTTKTNYRQTLGLTPECKRVGKSKAKWKKSSFKIIQKYIFHTLTLCSKFNNPQRYFLKYLLSNKNKANILYSFCFAPPPFFIKRDSGYPQTCSLMTTLMVLCLHLLYVGITGVRYHTGLKSSLKSRQNDQVGNIKLKLNTSNSEISVKLFSSDFSGFSLAHLLAASASSFSVSRLGLSNTYHK